MRAQKQGKLRYAVVGLGHIAQAAVLPAFAHAKRNSRLDALVSGDKAKLRVLGRKYKVSALWSYREYAARLAGGAVDAAYIALPNHLHRKAVIEAAEAGVHVLCEKPMAVSEADCRAMIGACRENQVRLMVAYRLHLDPATLQIMDWVRKGKIGKPAYLQAALSMDVRDPENIRLNSRALGGGPLYDQGIYCVNAARMFFGAEPEEMAAQTGSRAGAAEDTLTGLMRFPGGRLAAFACSNKSASLSEFTLAGEKGLIRLEGGFSYAKERSLKLELGSEERGQKHPLAKHDQFAAELLYFSDCVLEGRDPEPSGWEGLADVRVIEALYRAAQSGRSQRLAPLRLRRPQKSQGLSRPPARKTKVFHAKEARQR
jgi:predicted dehydrogenase